MQEIIIDPTKVVVEYSKIIELSIRSNMEALGEPDGKSYDLDASYSASTLHSDEGDVFLDFTLNIGNNNAPTYDTTIVTRTKFAFLQDVSTKAQDIYLFSIGLSRAMDYAKTYIKAITAFGMHGSFEIPGVPISFKE